VDVRLDWAAKEMFGGKLLFPLLISNLISAAAAAAGKQLLTSAADHQAFIEAAGRIMRHVLAKGREALCVDTARNGRSVAVSALQAAQEQLSLFEGSCTCCLKA
jgi:hypothetical protein